MNNISINKMCDKDLESISPILATDFDEFWTKEIFRSELHNPNSEYYIILYNSEIAGFGGIWISVDDVHLTNIVIKKSYRNKGLGSILLDYLISIAKTKGKLSLTLEVNENNEYAKKMYLKYGFNILGTRKKYYNNKDNAIIMTLYFN